MPAFAVCGTVPRVPGDVALPASGVLADGDCFKMVRIDTKPHAAKMIYAQSLRDRATGLLIREPMTDSIAL